jgi:hypothetical protein
MQLVLQKQSSHLANSGSSTIGSYGGGGGGSSAAGGMGNLAQDLISSLQDLTSGIKKLVTAVQFNTKAIMGGPATTPSDFGGGKGLEKDIENNRAQQEQTSLLFKIEENTRGMGGKKDEKKKDKKSDSSWLDSIATWGLAIAAALGVVAGLFSAQIKTMKFFGKLLMEAAEGIGSIFKRFAKFLGLDEIGMKIEQKFKNMVSVVEGIIESVKSRVSKIGSSIGSFFEESIAKFKKYFSFFEESDIGKKLKSIANFVTETVSRFVAPFKDAFSALGEDGTVMKIVKRIKDFFGGIGEYFGKFAKVFGVVTKLVAKLAYPIQIIMGVWDTVEGAIEGFKKEGILGAIQGGITGLINGVFMSFFDLVKDGISWILEKIGFKDASKFLDSFTFSDLFASLMDKIFHPIRTLQEAFDNLDLKALVFEPMDKAWKWLNDSLGGIPQKIYDNINQYIITPLSNAFTPVVNFFQDVATKLIGFFKDFKIPGIDIKIPFKDDPLKIGPWYPFKGAETEQKAAGESPKPIAAGNSDAKGGQGSSQFAATDPRRVDTIPPQDANAVTNASKNNADAAAARNGGGGDRTNIVNAPVSNMSKTTNVIKPNIRNQESSNAAYGRRLSGQFTFT